MKKLILMAAIALSHLAANAQGTTQNTVVPYGLESQIGNQHTTQFGGPGDYQYWFRGSYLAQAWNSPVAIEGLAFRVNEQPVSPRPYDAVIPRVEIWLTTTSRDSSELHSLWQFNRGADARMVFAADNVHIVSPGGEGPNPFGLAFSFSEPFYYNPLAGQLLMRIQTFPGSYIGSDHVDMHGYPNLQVSPVATIGGPFDTPAAYGIVTEFAWHTVPEPSTTALLTFAAVFALIRRPNNRKG